MRLETVTLTNFRCFRNEAISLLPFTAIVGPNNAGKSTIFRAIDLFFRTSQRTSPLSSADFGDPKKELRISLTFGGLSEKPLEGFEHYQRHGKLEFFIRGNLGPDGELRTSIHGRRKGIAAFADFFRGTANDRKAFYRELRATKFKDLPSIPTKSAVAVFETALFDYEAAHPELHEMLDSEDLAFGATGVVTRLRRYIDWVYIPAVKDAADEDTEARNTAFGILVNRLVRARVDVEKKMAEIQTIAHAKVSELVDDYKGEISKLQQALDTEFRSMTSTNAHVHLDWSEMGDDSVSLQLPVVRSFLSDDSFKGDVSRFGHGLQRNYLMALVHINATFALDEERSIVIACEEPELYQHPPQARYLHFALQKIAKKDQVLITSHSPYFISARSFESVRVVRKGRHSPSRVSSWTADEHRNLIAKAVGEEPIGEKAAIAKLDQFIQPELNEAFFAGKLVLVEGLEDRAILMTALLEAGREEEFAKSGGHIIGVNGKGGLVNMVALARGFQIPYFVMFDGDTKCPKEQVENNRRLNSSISALADLPVAQTAWPNEDVFLDRAVVWVTDIQGAMAAENPGWLDQVKGVCLEFGWRYDRLHKNPAVLSHALNVSLGSGKRFHCLDEVVARVMKFVAS